MVCSCKSEVSNVYKNVMASTKKMLINDTPTKYKLTQLIGIQECVLRG